MWFKKHKKTSPITIQESNGESLKGESIPLKWFMEYDDYSFWLINGEEYILFETTNSKGENVEYSFCLGNGWYYHQLKVDEPPSSIDEIITSLYKKPLFPFLTLT